MDFAGSARRPEARANAPVSAVDCPARDCSGKAGIRTRCRPGKVDSVADRHMVYGECCLSVLAVRSCVLRVGYKARLVDVHGRPQLGARYIANFDSPYQIPADYQRRSRRKRYCRKEGVAPITRSSSPKYPFYEVESHARPRRPTWSTRRASITPGHRPGWIERRTVTSAALWVRTYTSTHLIHARLLHGNEREQPLTAPFIGSRR